MSALVLLSTARLSLVARIPILALLISSGVPPSRAATDRETLPKGVPRGLKLELKISSTSWRPWQTIETTRTFVNSGREPLRFNPVADLVSFADGLEIQHINGESLNIVIYGQGHITSSEENPEEWQRLEPGEKFSIVLNGSVQKRQGPMWDILRERQVLGYRFWFGMDGFELPKEACVLKIRAVWNPRMEGRTLYDLRFTRNWALVSEWITVKWNPEEKVRRSK